MRFIASCFVVAVLSACGAGSASAQHHHHGGHSHHGHYHGGGYGGWGWGGSSYYGRSTFIGTPGFYSGVISPYYGGYGWGGYYPSYGYGSGYYGTGYNPYNGYGWPYYGGGFAAPPVIVPAETWYGPSAVRRMMGLDPPLGTPIVRQTVINLPATATTKPTTVNKPIAAPQQPAVPQPGGGFGVLVGNAAPPRPNVPTTNAATQARARKEIDAGDAAFQKQRYADAFSNYKDASRTAPDLAESYVRQAAASVAMKRYDDAVAQLKFGLQLSTSWVDGPFRTAALYGDDMIAQTNHLDALAQATLDRPSSDLLFLTGVMLYFADPQQRAEPLLKRATGLSVGETWHIDPFLQSLERQRRAARNVAGARDL